VKLLNAATRRVLPAAVFVTLLFELAAAWVIMRFVHRDAQYRLLAPDHYLVQVVTADDYRRLADPASRRVALSDGTTVEKAPVWNEIVLPNFKPTDDGRFWVLVTTKGSAHLLDYVEPNYVMFGLIAAGGLAVALWNLKLPDARRDGDAVGGPDLPVPRDENR
jgi:hypothetical protein